ncbi:hypothetical protein ACOTTU_19200 [Roseobacter sp. EG26]|uniref:hypothetical protein n=1 Tax=Roseobacter sp. EG26 TaxID=3412477 RepID=UPI003CE58601
MRYDVKWQNGEQISGLSNKRRDLRDLVRFLARRAAERTWKTMQNVEDNQQRSQGEGQ